MDELNEPDRQSDVAIQDALHTHPLSPAPENLFPAVMQRIAAGARPNRAIPSSAFGRFYPAWIDYVLSLFAASMVAVLWFVLPSLSLSLSLPPDWPVRVQYSLMKWEYRLHYGFSLSDILVPAGALLSVLATLAALKALFDFGKTRLTKSFLTTQR